MFSSKIYIAKIQTFMKLKKTDGVCVQLHIDFCRFVERFVYTISALSRVRHLSEIKFLKNLKQQIILHVFIKNLYAKNEYF